MCVRDRNRLIDCYATFFENQCGAASRRVILPLLRMHYSFDFLPPCGVASAVAAADVTPPPAAGARAPGQQPVGAPTQLSPPGSAADPNCPCAVAAPVPLPVIVAQPTTRSTRSLPVATESPLPEPLPARSGASLTTAAPSLLPAALISVLVLVLQPTRPVADENDTCGRLTARIVDRHFDSSTVESSMHFGLRYVGTKFPRR